MTPKRLVFLFVVGAVGLAAPLFGESGGKKLFSVTNTQQIPFQPGGTVHLTRSYGYLSVEGWDRPEVELTVIKSLDNLYGAKDQAEATKRVETVHVTAERRSDTELEISTVVPHYSRWTHPLGSTGGVMVEYQIHVPRNSKLVIQHGAGDVIVSNVTADIDARSHAGDIVLLLPETEKYSIDAKSKIGTVSSDFDGDFHRRMLMGIQNSLTAPAPAHRIYLRTGLGGITIKGSPASAQPPAAGGSQ
jgi:hypothetical protein